MTREPFRFDEAERPDDEDPDELEDHRCARHTAHPAPVMGQADRRHDIDEGGQRREAIGHGSFGGVSDELDTGPRGGGDREDSVHHDDDEPRPAGPGPGVGRHSDHTCHTRTSITTIVNVATTMTIELHRLRSAKATTAATGNRNSATMR